MAEQQETYDPFPRPGDEDFTSFPKHVPEDTCVYQVYSIPATDSASPRGPSNKENKNGNSLAALQRLHRQAKELEKKYLGTEYIWHREPFRLELEEFTVPEAAGSSTVSKATPKSAPTSGQGTGTRWRLAGRTSHGDSLADEWAIVFILRELTRIAPDAWARIEDADGEFLLVEAAHALPRWVEPEVAANRVWLHGGRLELVPPSLRDVDARGNAEEEGERTAKKKREREAATPIELHEALSFIARHGDKEASMAGGMVHSQLVEDEAFYRLRNHPEPAFQETFHRARVLVPRTLAYILHRCPQHISAAVESFYLRDPLAAKTLLFPEKNAAGLKFAVNDLVEASVRFTRVGYAQVTSQDFGVPPAHADSAYESEGAQIKTKSRETGLKLAAGFEMLVGSPANDSKRAVREISLLLDDLEAGEDTLPTDTEIAAWPSTEDDERWLDVDYADFEAELSGKGLRTTNPSAGLDKTKTGTDDGQFGDKAAQENLRRIVERFEKFLNDDDAGPDGALFGDEDDSNSEDENPPQESAKGTHKEAQRQKDYLDRETLDSDDDLTDENPYDDEDEDESGEDHEASFDEAEFEDMMRQMMGMPPGKSTDRDLLSTPPTSKQQAGSVKGACDDPQPRTPHQFSFDDPQTSGALPIKEPTIRERIAALDLEDKSGSDKQSAPFITAKAFQHWAAQQDEDFSDDRDRASYLRKQGLPVLEDHTKAKATINGKRQRTSAAGEQAIDDESRSAKSNGFVSLSADLAARKPSESDTVDAGRGRGKGRARFTTRSDLVHAGAQGDGTRVVELSSDEDEDMLAPTSSTAQTETPSRWVEDHQSDDDDGNEQDEGEAMQAAMAAMQAELEAAGIFSQSAPDTLPAVGSAKRISGNKMAQKKGKGKGKDRNIPAEESEDDPRYILAKNLLEAFKSGGGTGPAQSMLAALGMGMGALPRDGDDNE